MRPLPQGKVTGVQVQQATNTVPSQYKNGDPTAGKQVFETAGCKGCHTLKDAGATGTVGPDLDQALKGKSAAFIKQSIVDPNAVIANGYSGGIMPQNFKATIPPTQLDALVSYLSKVTSK